MVGKLNGDNPYSATAEDIAASYRRVHANSEQTHIAILSAGDSRYVAVAYDVDPVEFSGGAGQVIAYDPTLEGVVERSRRWMETHPRGVAGEQDGGGIGQKINQFFISMFKKLNEYGNRQVEQIEQQQGGKQ